MKKIYNKEDIDDEFCLIGVAKQVINKIIVIIKIKIEKIKNIKHNTFLFLSVNNFLLNFINIIVVADNTMQIEEMISKYNLNTAMATE